MTLRTDYYVDAGPFEIQGEEGIAQVARCGSAIGGGLSSSKEARDAIRPSQAHPAPYPRAPQGPSGANDEFLLAATSQTEAAGSPKPDE